jgi:hypothetical protein
LHFPATERVIFFASTSMAIGNGRTTLFWEDRWIGGRAVSELAPQLYDCVPKRRRKTTTVAAGLEANSWARDIHGVLGVHEVGQYLCLWQAIAHTKLAIDSDRLVWKWSPNGVYSAQSCYRALFHGSLLSQSCKLIWKTWAPPRVKFHHWLAAQDRCWTADRLARRGLQHHAKCVLCDQLPETMHHLTMTCPFSRQVWHEVLAWLRLPCQVPSGEASLTDWWIDARRDLPKPMRKGLATVTLLTPWMIWKHRNECVFDRATPSVQNLLHKIKDEARLWATAGAKGLRDVWPTTWDVH